MSTGRPRAGRSVDRHFAKIHRRVSRAAYDSQARGSPGFRPYRAPGLQPGRIAAAPGSLRYLPRSHNVCEPHTPRCRRYPPTRPAVVGGYDPSRLTARAVSDRRIPRTPHWSRPGRHRSPALAGVAVLTGASVRATVVSAPIAGRGASSSPGGGASSATARVPAASPPRRRGRTRRRRWRR